MASFPDTTLSENSNDDGLDPLFLHPQSLSEDLRRWSELETRLRLAENLTTAAAGLRERQASILILIAHEGERMSVKALLSYLPISKQNLHNGLQDLVRKGYLRDAGNDEHDRRLRMLALTTKGSSFLEDLTQRRADILRRAYRAAGALQVEGFRRTLLLLREEETK